MVAVPAGRTITGLELVVAVPAGRTITGLELVVAVPAGRTITGLGARGCSTSWPDNYRT